jgi:hypothetical protein
MEAGTFAEPIWENRSRISYLAANNAFTKARLRNYLQTQYLNQQEKVNEAETSKCHAFINAFCVVRHFEAPYKLTLWI